jgi:MFS family permease
VTSWHDWYYAPVFLIAIAGGAVMTLAWSLLLELMPGREQASISGLALTTRGVGLLLGPPLAGFAVDLFEPMLESTEGYAAVWPTVAAPVLLVIPIVAWLRRREVERARVAAGAGID